MFDQLSSSINYNSQYYKLNTSCHSSLSVSGIREAFRNGSIPESTAFYRKDIGQSIEIGGIPIPITGGQANQCTFKRSFSLT